MLVLDNEHQTREFGRRIGAVVRGGEVFELIGDLGTGKTTFAKGLGEGLGVDEDVQSPSFTLSRVYEARDGLALHHYDLYRLDDAGIVGQEFEESVADPQTITLVEWAETVHGRLPASHITLHFRYTPTGDGRECLMTVPDDYAYVEAVA